MNQLPIEHQEPIFHHLAESNLHSLVNWHAEEEDRHRRLKEACIAELAIRGLIQTESVGE